MPKSETAIIVFSGKFLEKPFSLDMLDPLRSSIEQTLADREVVVARRIATLSEDRLIAAPQILLAGFEAVPADDEDMQAAAIILSELGSANPPDEVVFALGVDEPVYLMRMLSGRVRRTALCREEISEEFGRCLDNAYQISTLLSKEGVNVSTLNMVTWDEWKNEFDGDRRAASKSVAAESASAPEPVDAAAATSVDTAATAQSEPDPQADVVAELCQGQSKEDARMQFLRETAADWNLEIEKLLEENDYRASAFKLTERLDRLFPGLSDLYMNRRDVFQSLLSDSLKLIQDDDTFWIYHSNHPDMRPVAAGTASDLLNIGATAEQEETTEVFWRLHGEDAEFSDVAEQAQIMSDLAQWQIDRARLIEAGNSHDEDVKPRDLEFDRLAAPTRLYLWLKHLTYAATPEMYAEARDCYDFVAKTCMLLDGVAKKRQILEPYIVADVMQLGADAQCMLKSLCEGFNLDIRTDHVQQNAFKSLDRFRKTYYPNQFIYNMRLNDRVSVSELPDCRARLEELSAKVESAIRRAEGQKKYEDKIAYYCDQIEKKSAGNVNSAALLSDWNSIVDAVTVLCQDFSVPPSSKKFRDKLIDLVDSIPDELEATEEFANVRAQIDFHKLRQEEEFLSAAPEPEEKDYSPEMLAVRDFYGGSKVVFIGGNPQDHLKRRIEKQLNVELIWFETSHGDSLDSFNPYLNDPEVRLFLVYIPWCSHKHSVEFSRLVKATGKDFVRLRKGTNPGQIAQSIATQVDLTRPRTDSSADAA